MNKFKWSKGLILCALLLSHLMCGVVAFAYAEMLCCIRHGLCSAPAEVALVYAIPFLLGIALCVVLAGQCRKRGR